MPDRAEIVIELDRNREFRRVLTMQGADSKAALAASNAAQAAGGNGKQGGQGSVGDGDGDGQQPPPAQPGSGDSE